MRRQVIARVALEIIRSALGDHVQLRAGRLNARIAAAGGDLNLFEGIEVVVGRRAADRADVGDVHSIDVECFLRIGCAAGNDDVLLTTLGAADVDAIELNARSQSHDDERIASGRKLFELSVRDDGARSRFSRVDQRRLGSDGDRLGDSR